MNMNVIKVTDEGKIILLRVIEKELKRLVAIPAGKATRQEVEERLFLASLKDAI